MIESFSDIPKKDPRRASIARQIRFNRSREDGRIGHQETNRTGSQYIEILQGVDVLFNYVRRLPSSTVLDIGAGTTKGISDIAKSKMGEGLTFKGTVLTNKSEVAENLGKENVYHTPVELLRGVSDSSIGAVIAVLSAAYSDEPELAVSAIDRVLVPGGAFKGVFGVDIGVEAHFLPKSLASFEQFFQQLHYDIAKYNSTEGLGVLLAVKPGGMESVRADDLFDLDKVSIEQQLKTIEE